MEQPPKTLEQQLKKTPSQKQTSDDQQALYLVDNTTDWSLRARSNGELNKRGVTYLNLSHNVWYPDFVNLDDNFPQEIRAAIRQASTVYLAAHQEPFSSQATKYVQTQGARLIHLENNN